jgi:hypothetical protein
VIIEDEEDASCGLGRVMGRVSGKETSSELVSEVVMEWVGLEHFSKSCGPIIKRFSLFILGLVIELFVDMVRFPTLTVCLRSGPPGRVRESINVCSWPSTIVQ